LGGRILGKSKVIITFGWIWWRHQRAPLFSLASGPPTLNPPLATSNSFWFRSPATWMRKARHGTKVLE